MLNADARLRVALRLALVLCALVLGLSAAIVSAGVGPENRSGANIPGQDFTVYRTVNTLSCHPQHPYPAEVPLYTVYAPTAMGGKGFCLSFHSQANPNFVGVQPGQPGLDGQGSRPAIPYRHYLVMEMPNPRAGATSGPNGRWVHWEGLVNVFELAVGSGKEIWYTKDFLGGMVIGENRVEIRPGSFIDNVGHLQQGAYYTAGSLRWRTCVNWAGPPRRPGDEAMPCFDYTVDLLDTTGIVWLNPNLYPTIPHNRYGQLTQLTGSAWALCLPEAVIAGRPTSRVYPVTPAGCDYPALTSAAAMPPLEGYIGGGDGPSPTPTLALTPTMTTTPGLDTTPTTTPIATPTMTSVEPTATPTLPADATPTAEATLTPTAVISATPDATATSAATATNTALPPTSTATPTLAPTLTATATLTPTLTRPPASPTVTRTPVAGLLTGISATASDNTNLAHRLIDGLTYTRWETNWTFPSQASFTLDLGSPRQIGRTRWQLGSVSMAQSFALQVSTDGQQWETLANLSPGAVSNAWQEQAIGRQTRYVRWLFSNPNNSGRLGGFSEVQLYGP